MYNLGFEDFDVIPVTNLSVDDGYLFSFFIRYDLKVHERYFAKFLFCNIHCPLKILTWTLQSPTLQPP